MFEIIQKRKIFLAISAVLFLLSILSLIFFGLKLGIEFTGGSLIEVEFKKEMTSEEIREKLKDMDLGHIIIQRTEKGAILKLKEIDEEKHQEILKRLEAEGRRFESIGAIIGKELREKAIIALILVLFGIILYIAYAFRKISKPVQSWKYGLLAVVALIHDVTITLGLFSFLGHLYGIEIDIAFVAALLTILGYSVNDTIIIYDRIRENLIKYKGDFEEIVNKSVNENLTRSLNTSLTTEFALVSIYFLGGETIRYFSLALIFGIFIGTYSSIFIASALLVEWQKRQK